MCNLYSMKSNQEAMRSLVRYISDFTGNMPPLPGIFPDYQAPIVRNNDGTRELAMARWGMPSPVFALSGLPMLKTLRQSSDEPGDLRPVQCFFTGEPK